MQKSCGIITIDCSIANHVMTAEEVESLSGFSKDLIVEKLGFEQKRVALANENPSDFAIDAAKKVLHKSGLNPANINFLIYCSNGLYDYQFWSPSAFIQKAIGVSNAIAFEINNGCNAANMGLFIAKSLLKTQCDWKYGLMIVSDTLSKFVNYSDPSLFPLFSFSDGAAAVIVAANHDENILLGQGFHTDGDFANCAKIECGGANFSPVASNLQGYIKMEEEEKTERLRKSSMADNYLKVIMEAMKQSSINQEQLSYILTNQNSRSIINRILLLLNIQKERHYNTSRYYGHVGAVDIFLGLTELLEKKLVSKNEFILAATAGIGFHWGAQVIKF